MPLPLLPFMTVGMIPGTAAAIYDHEVIKQPSLKPGAQRLLQLPSSPLPVYLW